MPRRRDTRAAQTIGGISRRRICRLYSSAASDIAPGYAADFLSTSEGAQLTRAFAKITDAGLRRRLSALVKAITGE